MKIAVIIFVVLAVLVAGTMLAMAIVDLWDERKRKRSVPSEQRENLNNDTKA